jgi:1-phosphofructokinase
MEPLFDVVTVTLNPAIDRALVIPYFRAGEVNRAGQTCETAGGKGVNVARCLAEAGVRVGATGLLGEGNAQIFEELFAEKSIADLFVRCPGESRVGIKISDPVRGLVTDINFPGVTTTPLSVERFCEVLEGVRARWFVLSGSLPPGCDPDIYGELVDRLRAAGAQVAVDTSGEPLRLALEAGPDLVKPNVRELEELLRRPFETAESIREAARHLCLRGVRTIAVSMGEEGAWVVSAEESYLVRPPQVPVTTTVGAGDAMMAGLVLANLRSLPLAEGARLGTAFALNAVSGSGPATLERVLPWMERVTVSG